MHDSWLPIGYALPDGSTVHTTERSAANWQIVTTRDGGRALLFDDRLGQRWIDSNLIESGSAPQINFGQTALHVISSRADSVLASVADSTSPSTIGDAFAFASALRATRECESQASLHDAIYVEKLSRLLPVYSITTPVSDDIVLGYWLTGGARVSVHAERRLKQMLSWMSSEQLDRVLSASGLARGEKHKSESSRPSATERFTLPGREALERFFNEHVIDIVEHPERYKAFGINFPGAVVLHGPPGCGKTFAVARLVEYLAWPSFHIDASSVASPYIHETSRKVADIFEDAAKSAPSILVIDEMEAFLADREMGSGHHRVEEVAEFLRRIPEAYQNRVLIIGMTNRIDMIDPAVLRRGRFDHVIEVKHASQSEISNLFAKLLAALPISPGLDISRFASQLAGRPLSDVVFVVREAGRIAARSGKATLDAESLQQAMEQSAPSTPEDKAERIGFI